MSENQFPKWMCCLTLLMVMIAGCTTSKQNTPSPAPSQSADLSVNATATAYLPETPVQDKTSGPLATAQAQASEVAFVTPPPADLPPEFEPWIQDRSHKIKSLSSEDFSDLQFLEPLLDGKRIVQLGEDNHSTKEQSLMKVRLIKYLHQELGFEVIAFESGLLDCHLAYQQIEKYDPQAAMEHCIFEIWHTEEVLPLFEYLTSVSQSSFPLILAGFDNQPSQVRFDSSSDFYFQLIKGIDSHYAEEIRTLEKMFLTSSYKVDLDKSLTEFVDGQDPVTMYDDLAIFMETHKEEINQSFPDYPKPAAVARQGAWSRARFIEQMKSESRNIESNNIRDHAMARNVQFLTEELYPDKKIIIWAHNKHISESPSVKQWTNMGAHLEKYFGDSLYTIGLFGYRPGIGRETLKSILFSYGESTLFVNLAKNGADDTDSFQPRLSTYNYPAGEYFDALIFFKKITVPDRLSKTQ